MLVKKKTFFFTNRLFFSCLHRNKQTKALTCTFCKGVVKAHECMYDSSPSFDCRWSLGAASQNKYFHAIYVSLSAVGLETDPGAQVAWQPDKLAPKLAGRFAEAGMCLP